MGDYPEYCSIIDRVKYEWTQWSKCNDYQLSVLINALVTQKDHPWSIRFGPIAWRIHFA